MKKDISSALYKKAVGYTAKEVVEEYGGQDGELLKRKVSKKHIPPDISALKTYLELNNSQDEFENISDEELEKIKTRLLQQLQQIVMEEKNENSNANK